MNALLGAEKRGNWPLGSNGGHSSIGKKSYAKVQRGGGGGKPRHGDALETRRFWSVSSRLKAWRNTLVSRYVLSPGDNASPFLDASSVLATRLSVQFRPFRGVTPRSSLSLEALLSMPPLPPLRAAELVVIVGRTRPTPFGGPASQELPQLVDEPARHRQPTGSGPASRRTSRARSRFWSLRPRGIPLIVFGCRRQDEACQGQSDQQGQTPGRAGRVGTDVHHALSRTDGPGYRAGRR